MSAEKTEAVVIRLADFSNTSRVVTFFTRDFGKISAIAKGGKRLKGPFDTALDLLSTSRIVFLRKSSSALDILTEASLQERFRPAPGDMNGYYAGCYVAELLAGLTEPYDPHVEMFDAAGEVLATLSQGGDFRLPVLTFELRMLREIGQLPSLDECIHCGAAIESHGSRSYWMSQGGILCPDCQQENYSDHPIQAGTVAILRALSAGSEIPSRISASDRQIRELRHTITSAVSTILGRRPSTLRFLRF
ncbi:DNA repair protein RecO [bacterium]|nr:DNA repair protein RecO [bacterium]